MPFTKEFNLPDGYGFRPLQKSDFHNNYTKVLEVLTVVGNVTEEAFNATFEYWQSLPQIFHPHVITNTEGVVVATGMMFVEKKIIRECALLGHIEDISVAYLCLFSWAIF